MATKKKYKSKSQEEIKKELDELIQHSMDKIKKYNESPEEVLEFTNFMSKIHNYSITNLFLIEDQFHGAQAVASYADWKKYGFQVQKGEKGIKIYAYTPYVMFIDEHGETKQLKEATPEQKEKIKNGHLKSKKIKSFKTGHVFDVSQTDATPEDLPKIFPNKVWNFNLEGENSIEQLEAGVKSLADSLNININDMKESSFGEMGVARGVYAQYIDGKEEIVLNSRNSRTQNIATSIHELAHKKLHNLDNIKDLPKDQKELGITNTEIKEFQAEMTSYIVCKNYGMDTSEKAIPYIAKWTKNGTKIDPKLTRAILTDVKNTASEFIENIDKTIISKQERQQEQQQLKENDVKEIEANQQPKMAQKNSFENDQFKVEKEVGKIIGKSFNYEDNALFKDRDLTNIQFYDCVFKDLNLENINLNKAGFSSCVFDNVNAMGSNFGGANIFKSEIKNSNLENCDFSHAKLKDGSIKKTNLSGVDFRNAIFDDEHLYDITINNAPKNIESIYITMGGATHSEIATYKENIMNTLDKHDFTKELNCKNFHYINMFKHYENKYPDLDFDIFDSEIATIKIGQNEINLDLTIDEIEILDMYGVTTENTALHKNDWKHIPSANSKDTCMYVERFINESIVQYELERMNNLTKNEFSQENDIKITNYSLDEIVLDEFAYNLSEHASIYYDKDNWKKEIENQLDYNSISSLSSCEDPKQFYQEHKEEIEQTLSDLSKEKDMDIRSLIEPDNYKDMASLIAYKVALTSFQNEINNFTIPDHSVLEKPVEKEMEFKELSLSRSQGMEME
ncbi:TPA: pentapeptide repeat-containing protein [Clostridium botulinum]|nr:pentapeptide repeat-containing protein [Clostridium botulinum]